jgi:type IV secretory pathway VirB2 component (pilin)
MWVLEFHSRLANTALLYTLAMLIYSLILFFRKQNANSNYWGALAIAEGVYLIQVILGTVAWLTGMGELERFFVHALYGIVSVLVVPGMFLYSRGRENRWLMLIFAGALLFQAGIILRGMSTA